MLESVPNTRYSSVYNVLRQWSTWVIPTYKVYRLYDTLSCAENINVRQILMYDVEFLIMNRYYSIINYHYVIMVRSNNSDSNYFR